MSEKLLSEKIQKKNNSADNKAADAETPLKKEEGKKKDIQSTNNKKEAIYGNRNDKYKDSSSSVNELQKELEQINQSDQKSDPSNSCRKVQTIIIGTNREQNNENEEAKNLINESCPKNQINKDSFQEMTPKEPESNFNYIKEFSSNLKFIENINQKSTDILNDDKNSLYPKKKENIIAQTNNNINKNKSIFLTKKHTIEPKDKNMNSKKDRNNTNIIDKTNFIKNNKFSHDNSFLDFCKINNHNEQQNISCSKKKLIKESPFPNLLSAEMGLREAGVGMDDIPIQKSTPNYDDNEGDNDIDKIIQNGIKNCQNIDANYGLYKKECEKEMKTVNDFNLNSISSSFLDENVYKSINIKQLSPKSLSS